MAYVETRFRSSPSLLACSGRQSLRLFVIGSSLRAA